MLVVGNPPNLIPTNFLAILYGYNYSVCCTRLAEASGLSGMERWNGMVEWNGTVEWNSGMTGSLERALPDELYPISALEACRLRSWKVSECQDGGYIAQGD